MQAVLISLLIAWCFERAQAMISAPNYSSLYNGFGAIDLTVARETKAPMAYRVLVPFLVIGIERLFHIPENRRINVYETIKIALQAFAFWAVWQAWGLPAALLTFLLLLLTIMFDYWDWAVELAGVALAMSGNLVLTLPAAILASLSRETALLVPVAYFLKTGDWKGTLATAAATVLTLTAVRLLVGRRPLYCDRWMIRYNLGLFKNFFKWQPIYFGDVFISLIITSACLPLLIFRPAGWPIPWVILAAGWSMAKADEARVFVVCLPWIAAALVGGL